MSEKEIMKHAIEICSAVYRRADKLSASRVLREKVQGLAIDILENLACTLYRGPAESGIFHWQEFRQKAVLLLALLDVSVGQNRGLHQADFNNRLKREYGFLYKKLLIYAEKSGKKTSQSSAYTAKTRHDKASERKEALFDQTAKSILKLIEANEGITTLQVAKRLNKSERTVRRKIVQLMDLGKLVRDKRKPPKIKWP